ncbi:MAG: hypothetical protein HYZ81_09865 [Nitrospinae bacterium]|nr:hypothetical protein [Nitrospinota bacterium]
MQLFPARQGFHWNWIVTGVLVMTGIYLISRLFLPFSFLSWIAFCVAYALGGALIGYFSPGLTFLEPAIAALISVALVNLYLLFSGLGVLILLFKLVIGFALALAGAFFGEKLQWEK